MNRSNKLLLGILISASFFASACRDSSSAFKAREGSQSPTPQPSPQPTASPSPLPTPIPSPSTSPSPTPRPSPSPSVSPSPIPSPSPNPTRPPKQGCFFDSAWELLLALDGGRIDRTRICAGNIDGADFLPSPGSENWVIAAQAALYVDQVNGTGDPKWFTDYFRVQVDGTKPYDGGEYMSYAYGSYIVGAILNVVQIAKNRGHTDLVRYGERWLQIYWAINTLGSIDTVIRETSVLFSGSTLIVPGPTNYNGLSVAKGAARSLATGTSGEDRDNARYPNGSYDHLYQTMALDWTPRSYSVKVADSDVRLRMFLRGIGFNVRSGTVFNFATNRVAPEKVGLTSSQRGFLNEYISSKGRMGVREIVALIGDAKPKGSAVFIKTNSQTLGYLGKWDGSEYRYNFHNCKTPIMAVQIESNGYTKVPHPHMVQATCKSRNITSKKEGTKLCVYDRDANTNKCIDMPTDSYNSIVELGPTGTTCYIGCN